jgi:cell division septal protein FtsQ
MTGPQTVIEPDVPKTGVRWRLLALVVLLVLLAPGTWLARKGASRMEFFHLRSVAVEGTRYLSPERVIERLALDTMRSVWDDTEPLAERLRRMPQIADVRISRRLPGTIIVSIRENIPVALAPSPRGLEPVDSAGVVLPIDPAFEDLDLPVANVRDRAVLSLLTSTRAKNPMLYHRISEIDRDGRDGLVLRLARSRFEEPTPGVTIGDSSAVSAAGAATSLRVRALLGVSVSRLADIFPVESDLVRRRANIAELDLRYRDQVIARLQ